MGSQGADRCSYGGWEAGSLKSGCEERSETGSGALRSQGGDGHTSKQALGEHFGPTDVILSSIGSTDF